MQLTVMQSAQENQLFSLLGMLDVAMKGLSRYALITKPERTLLDKAWHAAHQNNFAAFEKAINDLDSSIHFHDHHELGQEGAAQYRLVRAIIHCVQDVWPSYFQSH